MSDTNTKNIFKKIVKQNVMEHMGQPKVRGIDELLEEGYSKEKKLEIKINKLFQDDLIEGIIKERVIMKYFDTVVLNCFQKLSSDN